MKTILSKLRILIILLSVSTMIMAQPSWTYTNTGANHTILVQFPSAITINGVSVSANDYIGVFYDSLGTMACAGFEQVSSGTVAVTAWGTQPGMNDGFQVGEAIQWKIWRTSDSTVFNSNPTYATIGFPNQGFYAYNGMSSLTALEAVIGSDLAIGNILSPISGCGNLTSTETISFQASNVGSVDVLSFIISYSWDGGLTFVIDTISQTLLANDSYIYTSTTTFDLSAQGNYELIVAVAHPNDTDLSNNTFSTTIVNGTPPVIDLSGLATTYCVGPNSGDGVFLEGLPAGGEFSSDTIAILPGTNMAHFLNPGNFEIYYTYTDTIGCTSVDTLGVTVNPIPDIELGEPLPQCVGDTLEVSVPSGYALYTWSTGSMDTVEYITQAGLYFVTVTNTFSCMTIDSVNVIFNPTPIVDIQGDSIACEGETLSLSVAGQGTSYLWSNNSFNDFITVSETALYSVTVSSNGCLGYDNINVYFNPSPAVYLGSDQSICAGESITLDAGSFSSYLWNDGSTDQTITVTSEGTYSVTVTDAISCEGSDEINIYIISDPIADFSFTTNNYYVEFINESFFEDPGTWEWNFGDGTISTDENPSHTYSQDGEFNVSLKVANSCSNDSIIIALNILDIPNPDNQINISVLPNPSNGKFNIEITNYLLEEISVIIYNNLGQEIISKTDNSFSKNINLEFNLENEYKGIYFIRLTSKSGSYSKKIVLK